MKLIDTEALTGLPLLDLIAATPVPAAADPAPVPAPLKKKRTGTLAERHAANVLKAGPDDCWLWQGAADTGSLGYGRIRHARQPGEKIGRKDYAHRVAFTLHNGPIPDNHQVRHTCDNPKCCNPKHLITGIPADNVADMVARNRQRRNLKKSEAIRISKMLDDGITIPALAKQFKVSERTIRNIEHGVTWANDTGRTCTWPSRQKKEPARRRKSAPATETIEATA